MTPPRRLTLRSFSPLLMTAALLAIATTATAQPSLGTVDPTNVGVQPGVAQIVTFTANFANSSNNTELDVWMSNGSNVSPVNCYFGMAVFSSAPQLFLFDDNWRNWTLVPFGSGSASNSACQVNGQGSSYSWDNYSNLTLTVSLTFPASLVGQSFSYTEQAVDNGGNGDSSGWWPMPGASLTVYSTLGPSQLGTVTPANGTSPPNTPGVLTFTPSDPNTFGANTEVDILISANHTSTNACLIAYFTSGYYGTGPYLFSDDLTSWTSIQFGDDASNSQCRLMGQRSGAPVSPTTRGFRGPAPTSRLAWICSSHLHSSGRTSSTRN